jgi:2,5-dihydroxypyridine 5,6-dioxygenase
VLNDRIEYRWLAAFEKVLALSGVTAGDPVAILSESQSRPINVHLAELAALALGSRPFHIVMPTPAQTAPVPIRSTGATAAIAGLAPVVGALSDAKMVIDCTVEGMMHAAETPLILGKGGRILYVSNEHPEILERCAPDESLRPKVEAGIARLTQARTLRVTSAHGTDLEIDLTDAPCGGGWGYCGGPGMLDFWPGGLVACNPLAKSVNGTLVLGPGDINLTFKRYVERPIRLQIEADYITDMEGDGVDADLMRSYIAAWGNREAYAVSHLGWGMNPRARWDSMTMYDKGDSNGTEQRAFAGNFLYSTGANEMVGRYTLGHFDLPMKGCTLHLDGEMIVDAGKLCGELA